MTDDEVYSAIVRVLPDGEHAAIPDDVKSEVVARLGEYYPQFLDGWPTFTGLLEALWETPQWGIQRDVGDFGSTGGRYIAFTNKTGPRFARGCTVERAVVAVLLATVGCEPKRNTRAQV